MSQVAIPDVISDNVTDAARRLGILPTILFLRAAEHCRNGKGFSNNPEVGERFYRTWVRQGYQALPPAVKEFILAVNNGEYNLAPKCPECGREGGCHHYH